VNKEGLNLRPTDDGYEILICSVALIPFPAADIPQSAIRTQFRSHNSLLLDHPAPFRIHLT